MGKEFCPRDFTTIAELGKSKSSHVTLVRSAEGDYFTQKKIEKARLKTQQEVQHIWNERRALEYLNAAHPDLAIAKLAATAQDDEYLYFFFIFLSGAPLHHHIQTDKGFDENRCRIYTKQLANIFIVLHSERYAYRDLKASNVLLTEGRCHLVDFGFCKKMGDPPRTSSPCGTRHAMAPEVLANFVHVDDPSPYDAFLVDWWTLGILIFEMLNIKPPFGFHGTSEQFLEHALSSPGNISWPDVSSECKDFISQLLDPRVETRMKGTAVLEHPWLQGVDVASVPSWDDTLGHDIPSSGSPLGADDPFADF